VRAETALQRQIKLHLEAKGLRIVASANGAVLAGTPKQRAMQMNSLKASGLCVGFPDITVYGGGRRIGHIEVKLEGEPQGPKQIECQEWLEAMGHSYAVCRSIMDVDETLAKWGNKRGLVAVAAIRQMPPQLRRLSWPSAL